jgi:hypothetical protein
MFIMPTPAASSAMELTTATPTRTLRVTDFEGVDERFVREQLEVVFFAGGNLADGAEDAADLFDGILVAGLVGGLDQDREAAPVPAAIAVEAGGDGDDREIVLVAAQHFALGLEHSDHQVIDPIELHRLAQGRSEGEERFGE